MKNLTIIVIALLLFACDGSQENSPPEVSYTPVPLPEITFHESLRYNGQIDHISDNSWVFTSHTNDLCIGKLNSPCRKTDFNFSVGKKVPERITKFTFEFMVDELNPEGGLYWDIVMQYWTRIDPNDLNGNHPITTLKLKIFDGALNLCHYDNAWQWDYDFGDNRDGDNIDVDHSLHQENTLNGCAEIEVGVDHNGEIVIFDEGRFVFKVNDVTISDKEYQTMSPTESHVVQWGQYWDKGYNMENDPLKRIILRIDNLTMWSGILVHH